MVPSSDSKTTIKMAGYLEKKGKMRVVSRWKKLWFVLEGRLLLYYKSQLEYLSLSPCRGSVNMGLAASVLPGSYQEIIVATRSHTVHLRALNKVDHDIWLQALIDAMSIPNSTQSRCCTKPIHHFRYAFMNQKHRYENAYNLNSHATTLPNSSSSYLKSRYDSVDKSDKMVRNDKLDKYANNYEQTEAKSSGSIKTVSSHNGRSDVPRKSNKLPLRDISVPGKFKITSQDLSAKSIRRSFSVEEDVNKYGENIYESLKSTSDELKRHDKNHMRKTYRVNRSDSDCLSMYPREKILKNMIQYNSERRKINKPEKAHTLLGRKDRSYNSDMRFSSNDNQPWTLLDWSNSFENKVRSDTDLTAKRKESYNDPYLSSSYDFANLRELIKEKKNAPIPLPRTLNKRSNSILRHFSPYLSKSSREGRRVSVKKRSLSFLKKIWCRKESNKWEPNPMHNPCEYMQEMEGPDSDLEILTDMSERDYNLNYKHPRPEPPPDYDIVTVSDDDMHIISHNKKLNIPPRFKKDHKTSTNETKRSKSPTHTNTKTNRPVNSPLPSDKYETNSSWSLEAPELPPKTSTCIDNAKDLLSQDTDNGISRLFKEDIPKIVSELKKDSQPLSKKKDELTEILENLNTMNKPIFATSLYQNTKIIYEEAKKLKKKEEEKNTKEDPDYDIPRPHASLLPALKNSPIISDTMEATRFFAGQFEDSLDMVAVRKVKDDLTMAPDSLECDPWSVSEDTDFSEDNWSYHHQEPLHTMVLDSLYHDSINPVYPLGIITDYTPRKQYIHSVHNLRIS
ncbi:uncharacterized protein LOC106664384 [Cimex lectularius]|uniref:PH domain-containing protein n=1 Tax=Cimex lectularius TaxID=79782 RepID=A0A8I6RKS2_CIMLE|nr:uncharacterized protein LOC106664384 [Cimex lectularius]